MSDTNQSSIGEPHSNSVPQQAGNLMERLSAEADELAAKGIAQNGLRYLETEYEKCGTDADKALTATLIANFRTKNGLGQVWEFFDDSCKPKYELSDIEEIRSRLLDGSISAMGSCRKNRVGSPAPIQDTLAKAEGRIEILYEPIWHHSKNGAIATAVIGVIAGFFGGLYWLADIWRMGFFQTTGFAVALLLAAFFTLAAFGKNGCLGTVVGLVGIILLVGITGGKMNPYSAIPLIIGIPFSFVINALLGAIPGFLLGAVVGIVRMHFLPKLPVPTS